jgi:hypothetical protein
MNALYFFINRSMSSQVSRPSPIATSEEPLTPIRPGAFARWIAEVEGRTDRDEFATNEGIAAARPDAVPEPG